MNDVEHYATHAALKESPAWAELELVGVLASVDDEPAIELRNCTCGTTIGREMVEADR